MKILFFMNHYPDSRNGGIENVTRMLSEHFHGNGHTVDVAFLYLSRFDHSDDSIFGMVQCIKDESVPAQIKEWVSERNIDIIINRCVIFATPLIRQSIEGTGCKLLTTYNNKPTLDPPTMKEVWMNKDTLWWKKFLISAIYPIFCRRSVLNLRDKHKSSYYNSDKTVLLSDRYIPEFSGLMQIPADKLVVMNNPIRNGLKISEEEFDRKENTILMVTRLDETQKCIIKALDIWKNVGKKHRDWKLKIIGNGPDEAMIKKYAGNILNVEFIPACKPDGYYREASIFLMTSRNEGWPNTINEAMRMGCVPVVVSTFSAIYDMVDDGENGIIISPDEESDKMAEELSLLIIDSDKRYDMAKSAIKKTERLSIDIISRKWLELFQDVIGQ